MVANRERERERLRKDWGQDIATKNTPLMMMFLLLGTTSKVSITFS
jgi:hypothetical protein